MIWKDECFKSFTETWAAIYRPAKNKEGELVGGDAESVNFLQSCAETLFLVNVVDNDYMEGDLNEIMHRFIEANKELIDSIE